MEYKWVVLSNTTIGSLMASINATILIIALPAIFNGIRLNPLEPSNFSYLLWIIMGYMVVSAALVVTFGRLSDMFGRVRMYNLGFIVFTAGSILLSLTPGKGSEGALELIVFRVVQAVGGAFLFANSAALITDAFTPEERGKALGINAVAFTLGSLTGLIAGGILATVNWRLVFLVSVPVGIGGTIWSVAKLKPVQTRVKEKIDYLGTTTFSFGLILLLVGATYGIEPYGSQPTGWANPWVIASLALGTILLALFIPIESKVKYPMINLNLFKIRQFSAGMFSAFIASLAQGAGMFVLIIWLQGIYLPLHGVGYADTPLWAGIYMIPMSVGLGILSPVGGKLSDRLGARGISTLGMGVVAASFIALFALPANFFYPSFAVVIFTLGAGLGLFSAPNTASIMNAAPTSVRGTASGMRATLQNTGTLASFALFFSLIIIGMSSSLPKDLYSGFVAAGVPQQVALDLSHTPPTAALFAAFLGYNPVLGLPSYIVSQLSAAVINNLEALGFFPSVIAPSAVSGFKLAFLVGAGLALAAAVASVLRGKPYVYVESVEAQKTAAEK
jgi:MFS family permease